MKIDFTELYLNKNIKILNLSILNKDESFNWEGLSQLINMGSIKAEIKYFISGIESSDQRHLDIIHESNTNIYRSSTKIFNDNMENYDKIECTTFFQPNLKLLDLRAKLFAPDNSELGIFQPASVIKTEDQVVKVTWKLNQLKPMHTVEFFHNFSKQIVNLVESINDQKLKETTSYFFDFILNSEEELPVKIYQDGEMISNGNSLNQIITVCPKGFEIINNEFQPSINTDDNNYNVYYWPKELLKKDRDDMEDYILIKSSKDMEIVPTPESLITDNE
ncbi:MAG: hypothetical protein ACFFD1_01695, partial [Candidatus Thorarchaeota archaeon]